MENERDSIDEPPPLFKSWNGWYALVLGVLVLVIATLFLFESLFS